MWWIFFTVTCRYVFKVCYFVWGLIPSSKAEFYWVPCEQYPGPIIIATWTKLQNTRPLIYLHIMNNNSMHCYILRSTKDSDTGKWGRPKWPGILKLLPHLRCHQIHLISVTVNCKYTEDISWPPPISFILLTNSFIFIHSFVTVQCQIFQIEQKKQQKKREIRKTCS